MSNIEKNISEGTAKLNDETLAKVSGGTGESAAIAMVCPACGETYLSGEVCPACGKIAAAELNSPYLGNPGHSKFG